MRASDRETAQARAEAQAQAAWAEQLQQRVMRLEMENRELRRQLDELRRGVGIAVLIQGRPVALASPPPAMPGTGSGHFTDAPAMSQTGARPAINPQMGPAPRSVPSPAWLTPGPRSRVPSVPIDGPRSYAPQMWQGAPSQVPDAGPRSIPVPAEDLWLTGRQRAVQVPRSSHGPSSFASPYSQPMPYAPSMPSTPWQRPETPAQSVTPDWLRDPSPSMPLPIVPPTQTPTPRPTLAPMPTPAPRPASHAEVGQPPRRIRSGSAARPLRGARLEPADVPSLAQLTGKHPALRPAEHRADGNRNPYADSFVLD